MPTVESLKTKIVTELKFLSHLKECALLGYPSSHNIGDRMIWLGELEFFQNINKTKILYKASPKTFNPWEFEKKIGRNPIFLQGGGDLGDLYPKTQDFKEYIIQKYQKNEIVIFPQTILFQHRLNLEKAKKVFNSHPKLTVIAREQKSYGLAKEYFPNNNIILVPDMAFLISENVRNLAPKCLGTKVIFLSRRDKELKQEISLSNQTNIIVVDWLNTSLSPRFIDLRLKMKQSDLYIAKLIEKFKDKIVHIKTRRDLISNKDQASSMLLVNRGIDLLSNANIVITDRLHGHILSTLMGIKNIFLPNSYHKNWSFYNTWTKNLGTSYWCNNIKDALDLVHDLQRSEVVMS